MDNLFPATGFDGLKVFMASIVIRVKNINKKSAKN
jgi:hypothetical protein